ncbi:MAG: hypothetical protein FWF03_04680 [Defluviitaleaceae bacterium]|nr:hypothetical protein [Defluviitaleaceae bacterium]
MKKSYGFNELPPIARIIVIGSTLLVIAALAVFIGLSMLETKAEVKDGELRIKGFYGVTVPLGEITGVELLDMTIGQIGSFTRTNGVGGMGQTLLGNFRTGGESVKLFVKSKEPPTLIVRRSGGEDLYISFYDAQSTKKLYDELIAAL